MPKRSLSNCVLWHTLVSCEHARCRYNCANIRCPFVHFVIILSVIVSMYCVLSSSLADPLCTPRTNFWLVMGLGLDISYRYRLSYSSAMIFCCWAHNNLWHKRCSEYRQFLQYYSSCLWFVSLYYFTVLFCWLSFLPVCLLFMCAIFLWWIKMYIQIHSVMCQHTLGVVGCIICILFTIYSCFQR